MTAKRPFRFMPKQEQIEWIKAKIKAHKLQQMVDGFEHCMPIGRIFEALDDDDEKIANFASLCIEKNQNVLANYMICRLSPYLNSRDSASGFVRSITETVWPNILYQFIERDDAKAVMFVLTSIWDRMYSKYMLPRKFCEWISKHKAVKVLKAIITQLTCEAQYACYEDWYSGYTPFDGKSLLVQVAVVLEDTWFLEQWLKHRKSTCCCEMGAATKHITLRNNDAQEWPYMGQAACLCVKLSHEKHLKLILDSGSTVQLLPTQLNYHMLHSLLAPRPFELYSEFQVDTSLCLVLLSHPRVDVVHAQDSYTKIINAIAELNNASHAIKLKLVYALMERRSFFGDDTFTASVAASLLQNTSMELGEEYIQYLLWRTVHHPQIARNELFHKNVSPNSHNAGLLRAWAAIIPNVKISFKISCTIDEDMPTQLKSNWIEHANVEGLRMYDNYALQKAGFFPNKKNVVIKEIKGAVRCHFQARGFFIKFLFAITQLLQMGYMRIKEKEESRFFKIIERMPTELRIIICNRAYESPLDNVHCETRYVKMAYE